MSSVIVTGIDGSETAARAAETAARLADALKADLHVVCAYDRGKVERVELGGETYEMSTAASAQTVAEDAIAALRVHHPDLHAVAVASAGKPAEALVAAAEQAGAELIVIGNRRVQGGARIFGSIATDVAQKAPCDVYIAYTHEA